MGIKGLLQSLRPIERSINISEYKGKTVAIDGHCILHRGCFGAATNLALNKPTELYVDHFMHYIGLFQYHGVIPIVVFDGLPLPLKQDTNDERRRLREKALKEGHALYDQGRVGQAEKFFQQAVTISDEMINAIIRRLISKKVQCIVAPNEADAQLAHLVKTGKAEAVITEDSDLLAFGCNKCIYKIDRYGNGVELSLDQVLHNDASVFRGFDAETMRHACILSGCDYLPSLKGFGLKTVLKCYNSNKTTHQALLYLRSKHRKDFPSDYLEKFYLANLGFLYQWVYDIDKKNYVRLNSLPSECSPQDIVLLGRIPTIQDSSMYHVNRVIPKMTANEAIAKEFISYVDSVKENIIPHDPSTLPKLCKKSPKNTVLSSKLPLTSKQTPSPIMKAKSAGPLTERRLPQRALRIPAVAPIIKPVDPMPPLNISGNAAEKIKEQDATGSLQNARLNALYMVNGVLPRKKPKPVVMKPASIKAAAVNPVQGTNLSENRVSSLRKRLIHRDSSSRVPVAPADIPAHYMAQRQDWMADQRLAQLHVQHVETTKERIRRVQESKKRQKAIAEEQIAAQDSPSPVSLPLSVESSSIPTSSAGSSSTPSSSARSSYPAQTLQLTRPPSPLFVATSSEACSPSYPAQTPQLARRPCSLPVANSSGPSSSSGRSSHIAARHSYSCRPLAQSSQLARRPCPLSVTGSSVPTSSSAGSSSSAAQHSYSIRPPARNPRLARPPYPTGSENSPSLSMPSPNIITIPQNASYTSSHQRNTPASIISTTRTSSTTTTTTTPSPCPPPGRKRSFDNSNDHQSDHYSGSTKHLRCLR